MTTFVAKGFEPVQKNSSSKAAAFPGLRRSLPPTGAEAFGGGLGEGGPAKAGNAAGLSVVALAKAGQFFQQAHDGSHEWPSEKHMPLWLHEAAPSVTETSKN